MQRPGLFSPRARKGPFSRFVRNGQSHRRRCGERGETAGAAGPAPPAGRPTPPPLPPPPAVLPRRGPSGGRRYLEAQLPRLLRRQAAVQRPCKAERGRASAGAAAAPAPLAHRPTGPHPPSRRRPPAQAVTKAGATRACAGGRVWAAGLSVGARPLRLVKRSAFVGRELQRTNNQRRSPCRCEGASSTSGPLPRCRKLAGPRGGAEARRGPVRVVPPWPLQAWGTGRPPDPGWGQAEGDPRETRFHAYPARQPWLPSWAAWAAVGGAGGRGRGGASPLPLALPDEVTEGQKRLVGPFSANGSQKRGDSCWVLLAKKLL